MRNDEVSAFWLKAGWSFELGASFVIRHLEFVISSQHGFFGRRLNGRGRSCSIRRADAAFAVEVFDGLLRGFDWFLRLYVRRQFKGDDISVAQAALHFSKREIAQSDLDWPPFELLAVLHVNEAFAFLSEHRRERNGERVLDRRDRDAENRSHARTNAGVEVFDRDARGKSFDAVLDERLRRDALHFASH